MPNYNYLYNWRNNWNDGYGRDSYNYNGKQYEYYDPSYDQYYNSYDNSYDGSYGAGSYNNGSYNNGYYNNGYYNNDYYNNDSYTDDYNNNGSYNNSYNAAGSATQYNQSGDTNYSNYSQYFKKLNDFTYTIEKGFVPYMNVPGKIYVSDRLKDILFDELASYQNNYGGFLPAVVQVANVASLPGIVKHSIGMPDIHAGYGFAIGNVAAFDMNDPNAVVSPGGVGFDINCGMRLIRTNLDYEDIKNYQEDIAEALFRSIPVGVGAHGLVKINSSDLSNVVEKGIDWAIEQGYAWEQDKKHCEELGRMQNADSNKVSSRAKSRGLPQLGTLGAGNHYIEVQYVDEIYDEKVAKAFGITHKGQVCIMLHTGSRGFGHQVCTDNLAIMERTMYRDNIQLNDRQLACALLKTQEAQNYLSGMACAANFAFVNRSVMTHMARKAFEKVLNRKADDMEMELIYDVTHNTAKEEEHFVDNKWMKLLVHRKGATRAFPPNHPLIPSDYQQIGQPVIIGGTMGTYSYLLTGTSTGLKESWGTTCHGAGRCLSRQQSLKKLVSKTVMQNLVDLGISIRVASPHLIQEEAPNSYKNVLDVVECCHEAGLSSKCVRLRPVAVIKG